MRRGRQVRDSWLFSAMVYANRNPATGSGLGTEEQKGVRGGKCVKPTSNSRSFSLPSLSQQNIQWMLHLHTLPTAAGQCCSYIIALRPTTPGCADPIDRSLTTLPTGTIALLPLQYVHWLLVL